MAWSGSINWDSEHESTFRSTQGNLERASQSIARSTQIAVETEQIGTEVVSELGQQRETLLRARQRVADTDEELNRADAILRKMKCGVLSNKLTLLLIILMEGGILACLVYLKFFKKS
ncbi:vesicle transport through interaction with t-SNAREs homolog 1B [Thrips palmi]|uniref:Vesicle transport through interaction with t-SNAREs homolog 1B n=1 Tax=Thrips palmi TaxID=161013 RepID=A0A6P8Y1S7_THRPL|nr:vesicle transport through interaction with t-SNAREs homolog 1B [Thrips palmi]XP_034233474.1 vesicle transport through interaction with t-SNAREs homolog 1B [Thrips palmi]